MSDPVARAGEARTQLPPTHNASTDLFAISRVACDDAALGRQFSMTLSSVKSFSVNIIPSRARSVDVRAEIPWPKGAWGSRKV